MNEKNQHSLKKILSMISFCHRLPERTFKIREHYFPVCSRCTGIYLGGFSYFIYVYFYYVDYSYLLLLLAFLMTLPTFLDGSTQLFGFRKSNNVLRFFSGVMAGVGLAILIKAIKWAIIGGSIS